MGCMSSKDLPKMEIKTIEHYPNIEYPDSNSELYMSSDSSEVTDTVCP
jgi:hypothetical protein